MVLNQKKLKTNFSDLSVKNFIELKKFSFENILFKGCRWHNAHKLGRTITILKKVKKK